MMKKTLLIAALVLTLLLSACAVPGVVSSPGPARRSRFLTRRHSLLNPPGSSPKRQQKIAR